MTFPSFYVASGGEKISGKAISCKVVPGLCSCLLGFVQCRTYAHNSIILICWRPAQLAMFCSKLLAMCLLADLASKSGARMRCQIKKRIGLRQVRALNPDEIIWDASLPGFGARRKRSAAVSYVLFCRLLGAKQTPGQSAENDAHDPFRKSNAAKRGQKPRGSMTTAAGKLVRRS